MMSENSKLRKIYVDVLRVISAFAVVFIHTSCQIIDSELIETPVKTWQWFFANIYNGMSHFAVPVFFMISGALFLGRDIKVSTLYKKYVSRIIGVFLVWSCFYAVFIRGERDCYNITYHTLLGMNRFSFLLIIAGLYMIVPFLKKIVEEKTTCIYFIVMGIVVAFALPQLMGWIERYSIFEGRIRTYIEVVNLWIGRMQLVFPMGSSVYFVLGYFLDKKELSKKSNRIMLVGGAGALLISILMTYYDSLLEGTGVFYWNSSYTLNTLMLSCGVFCLCKEFSCKLSEGVVKVIVCISKLTLGVYVLHTAILDHLLPKVLGISADRFPAIISVPMVAVLVLGISLFITFLLSKIPLIKRIV